MDGNKLVSKLKKLENINSLKDVKPLTHYLFPGSHCPLMGAALAVRGIKDALLVVIGTDECTYYTKSLAMSSEFGGVKGRCVSIVLDSHDVTFGSIPTAKKAFADIIKEYKPSCVFLVTTCIIEIIGDDMDSLADELTDEYGVPILSVHTEHFKCQDHIPGIERTITACIDIMELQEKDSSVNILGQRLGDFSKTELCSILKENNIEIGLMLPSGCSTTDIKKAPKSSLNIVVNDTALPLAKLMEKHFNIPYVMFERFTNPDNIYDAYKTLFESLGKKIPVNLVEKYENAKSKIPHLRTKLENVSYIYGNTPFTSFEFNEFMCYLGLKPLLIQMSRFDENDKKYVEGILKNNNPYVTKSANIAPLQYVYDVLKPNLYLGHEYAARLQKKGIAIVRSDLASSMLGFEVFEYVTQELCIATEKSFEYRK